MRRRKIIFGSVALALAMLLLAWLALPREARLAGAEGRGRLAFGLAGEMKDSRALFTGCITNIGRAPFEMSYYFWQWEDQNGRIVDAPRGWSRGVTHMWRGVTNFIPMRVLGTPADAASLRPQGFTSALLPGGIAEIRIEDVPPEASRVRCVLQYSRDAGTAHSAIGKVFQKVPLGWLSNGRLEWLNHRGLLYGKYIWMYEGAWVANPSGAANGRQPFSSGTNTTSSAAGSRR